MGSIAYSKCYRNNPASSAVLHSPARRQYNIFKSVTTRSDLPLRLELIILYNLEQYEIFFYFCHRMLCLIYDWKWGDLHDCILFQGFTKKKNHFLSQWPWIKASCDKSWRTFTVQKAPPKRSAVKQLPWCPLHPAKVIYFWCLCSVRQLGSGNYTDFLRRDYQTYIEFRSSLCYSTKLVWLNLNSGNKWNLPKQNS